MSEQQPRPYPVEFLTVEQIRASLAKFLPIDNEGKFFSDLESFAGRTLTPRESAVQFIQLLIQWDFMNDLQQKGSEELLNFARTYFLALTGSKEAAEKVVNEIQNLSKGQNFEENE